MRDSEGFPSLMRAILVCFVLMLVFAVVPLAYWLGTRYVATPMFFAIAFIIAVLKYRWTNKRRASGNFQGDRGALHYEKLFGVAATFGLAASIVGVFFGT